MSDLISGPRGAGRGRSTSSGGGSQTDAVAPTDAVWQFWIDVGGTFTDCLAVHPDGQLVTRKVLSSGIVKGTLQQRPADDVLLDPSLTQFPTGFFANATISLLSPQGAVSATALVSQSDGPAGRLQLDRPILSDAVPGCRYELDTGWPAPVLAIRWVLGLNHDRPFPPLRLKLGTTRGTNALLTRRGARTAFITTRGLADVLAIGTQQRPRLFDLAIRLRQPLYECVIEVDERVAADGSVLKAADPESIKRQLVSLRAAGIESLAVGLLNSYANPVHEQLIGTLAQPLGFRDVSLSTTVNPQIKLVPRGETCVLNAYLNPLLSDYLAHLSEQLPAGALRVMTSQGGLVSPARFSGKDSLLSGPAGGVNAVAVVGRTHAGSRAIGLDMGGTSTDVCRFDGDLRYQRETVIAGVPVCAPMLAMETIAAGGGSVCWFDGIRLRVGPESAGADPGPACYGRGGPLCLTDMNLFLGRLRADEFPFALDREIVSQRLNQLCGEIEQSPLAIRYAAEELAQGFLDVANAAMARAARQVTIRQGYDPADYALVTFGGAAGLQACALARELRMTRIIHHPLAGVMSAYGIGQALIREQAEQPLLELWDSNRWPDWIGIFRDLAAQVAAALTEEGVLPNQRQPPLREFDLRSQGIESLLTIPAEDQGRLRTAAEVLAAFHTESQRLSGDPLVDRPVEVVALRVRQAGNPPGEFGPSDTHESPALSGRPADSTSHATATPSAVATIVSSSPLCRTSAPVWFAGALHETPLWQRSQLVAGQVLNGPAILCEPTSTLWIEPGFQGTVAEDGAVIVTPLANDESPASTPAQLRADPVQLEIFQQRFAAIAEEMGTALELTSRSTNVKERLDFSCALFTRDGSLVVNAPHIPVHLGAMSATVRCVLADHPEFARNQPASERSRRISVVTNDPYRGGSHLPDVTVVTPIYDPVSGELQFIVASRAHHAEIGGIVPGSMPPFSRTLAEEGVLLQDVVLDANDPAWRTRLHTQLTTATYPSRRPDDNIADLAAQLAANARGAELLWQLVREATWPVVAFYLTEIQAASASKLRAALAKLPPGTYRWSDRLDGGSPISVAITLQAGHAVVDFTGTGPVLSTNLNANRAIVTAAVLYVFRCLINEDIPLNGGLLEPLTIMLPECLLNPVPGATPETSPAMVGGNVETSQRVVDVLLGALGLAAASQGTMNNLTFGDDTFGYYETICGGSGATPTAAGASAVHTHMTNTRLTDPEIFERRYPVRLREFSIRRGSGGAGQFRGGDGIVRRIEFLKPIRVSLLTERRGKYHPFGLAGGQPGHAGCNTLWEAETGLTHDLGGKAAFTAQPGDVLTIETPGGGGYGPAANSATP